VKTKAVVGIALGLRFVYRLGLLHGAVKASNILLLPNPAGFQFVFLIPCEIEIGSLQKSRAPLFQSRFLD
jgi:hypothetical protein